MKPFVLSCVAVVLSAASLLFSLHSPVVAQSEGAGPKPVKVFRGTGETTTESFKVEANWVVRVIGYSDSSATILDSAGKQAESWDSYFDGSNMETTLVELSSKQPRLQQLEILSPFRFQSCRYCEHGGTMKLKIDSVGPWKAEIYQLPDEIP